MRARSGAVEALEARLAESGEAVRAILQFMGPPPVGYKHNGAWKDIEAARRTFGSPEKEGMNAIYPVYVHNSDKSVLYQVIEAP